MNFEISWDDSGESDDDWQHLETFNSTVFQNLILKNNGSNFVSI